MMKLIVTFRNLANAPNKNSHELMTMGGPSALELGGVNKHRTNKKAYVRKKLHWVSDDS
jgi:hypothetical protein